MATVPYWRLSNFYFCYFASLGIMLPFWNPYLYDRGIQARELGYLSAVLAVTKVLAPYLLGWVADYWGNRMQLIRIASLLSVMIFPAVLFVDSFAALALTIFAFSFFWNASLPQFEAMTLSYLGKHSDRYSQVRLWGSIGFIIAVLVAGYLLDKTYIQYQPYLICAAFLAIWLSSLLVSNKASTGYEHSKSSIIPQLKKRGVIVLFVLCFLMQFSHGAYYTFYSIYLQQHGYSETLTGVLWALGTLSEIVVFLYMQRWLKANTPNKLLMLCFVLTAVRWFFMAYGVDYVWLMVAIQLLHAFSFGMFHATMIYLIHQYFPGRLQGRGQALYSAISFGLGGVLGALISGWLWNINTQYVFVMMAVVACVGVVFTIRVKALTEGYAISK